ncbi:MAG: hypothetical protein R3C44_04275 [Chloroflexota bacterium]
MRAGGKSRLAGELDTWLESEEPEVIIFQGRGDQRFQHMPFSLLRDLLTNYFGVLTSDAPDVVEAHLLETLQAFRHMQDERFDWPPNLRERIRAVIRLVGLDMAPVGEVEPEMPDRAVVDRARGDILEFFELLAENSGAVVMFLEDIPGPTGIHWICLRNSGRLAENTRFVIVGLARPQFAEHRPDWLADGTLVKRHMLLRPLTVDDATPWRGRYWAGYRIFLMIW